MCPRPYHNSRIKASTDAVSTRLGPNGLTVGTLYPNINTSIPTVTDNLFKAGTLGKNEIAISFEPTNNLSTVNGVITWGEPCNTTALPNVNGSFLIQVASIARNSREMSLTCMSASLYQSLKVDTHVRAAQSRISLLRADTGASTKPLHTEKTESPS